MFSRLDLRKYKCLEAAKNPRFNRHTRSRQRAADLTSRGLLTAAGAKLRDPLTMRPGEIMIAIGLILLIIGFLTGIAILWTIGIIVLLLGLITLLLGSMGHPVGGRRHYW
jgi:hypothetical protein